MLHDDIFEKYDELVVDILEEIYKSSESGVTSYKAILLLKGNMTLRVNEIRDNNNLIKYAYYFLNPDNTLIIGWDNAPHHNNIETYPHHKHDKVQKNISKSDIRNLKDVFKKLLDYYNKL